jgi:diguanylate cyclase (GGDEF)-like protein
MFGFINVEFVARHKSCSDEQKSALKIISNILSDALIKIDAEKEISYMAYHDYLTKLPNRRLLNDRLKQAILLAGQANKRIGIFFIDLDGFKGVNDALGHEGGDILLRNFAGRLLEIVSDNDTLSRFGGDEFLLISNQISDEQDITAIADRIMKLFNQPFLICDQEFYLTASIGISVYPFDGNEVS